MPVGDLAGDGAGGFGRHWLGARGVSGQGVGDGDVDFANGGPGGDHCCWHVFFFARLSLLNSYLGLVLAHALLGVPFVVITVTAVLKSYDQNLSRAAASRGITVAGLS